MAVTITTNTLSPKVRYLNVSPSSVNADAKDVVLAVANAIIDLGWSRHDTLGATSVIGTDDNAGVVLRRPCYDFAQSGHYNYLGIRIYGSSNTTYNVYITQAADWSTTTSISSFVNPATHTNQYVPNSNATLKLSFTQGGTIWLFDGGKTLVMTSATSGAQSYTDDNLIIIGEYKKEYGENTNAATGYIHNGVFTTNRWLMTGSGAGAAGELVNMVGYPNGGSWHTALGMENSWSANSTKYSTTISVSSYSQFLLTEAPTTTTNQNTFSNQVAAPASCGQGFATRIMCGLYGYIGHLGPSTAVSILNFYTGETWTSTTVQLGTGVLASGGYNGGRHSNPIFAAYGNNNFTQAYALGAHFKEYTYDSGPGDLRFSMVEPLLSCGTSNGNPHPYAPVNYKFSVLGKMFDFKIFGPYDTDKYSFLDSISVPCDSDNFYQEGGTDTEFWFIPYMDNRVAFLMPK